MFLILFNFYRFLKYRRIM